MNTMLSREILAALAKAGRIDMIRTLKAYPERDFTINELARASGVPAMTAWRGVKELKRLGFVKAKRVGNATVVTITSDQQRLRAIRMIPETDPQRMAALSFAEHMAENPWVQECRLFGSISRGEHSPGDEVDVAVVFDDAAVDPEGAKRTATEAAARVKEASNVAVVPLCLSRSEMSRKGGLASELRDKERIFRRE